MKLLPSALLLLALSAPAFAQQAPAPVPPPEGFYRDVPNAYDLLLRLRRVPPPSAIRYNRDVNFCLTLGPRIGMTDPEKAAAEKARQSCFEAARKYNPALDAFIRSLDEKGVLNELLPPLE